MANVKLSSFHITDLHGSKLVERVDVVALMDARGHRRRNVGGLRCVLGAIGIDIEDGLLAGYDSSGGHLDAFWRARADWGGLVNGD